MSAQYDGIQAPYDEIRKTAIAIIERENVHEAVTPFINGARVLDLACGSGFYTREFVKWGASSVVGVDISAAMLAEAQRATDHAGLSTAATFLQADCGKPAAYQERPFQLVFGAWLLNYAAGTKELTELFRNISLNLEDGGYFVGVTPPPTQDPVAHYEAEIAARPDGSGLLKLAPTGSVEDGWAIHCHADTDVGTVDFDCYHLRKDVYEAAARAGGLQGKVEWILTTVTAEFIQNPRGVASVEELQSYKTTPHYGLIIIAK